MWKSKGTSQKCCNATIPSGSRAWNVRQLYKYIMYLCICISLCIFLLSLISTLVLKLFCGTGAWTQDLHLEPLCHPFFMKDFLDICFRRTICLGWLPTTILPISAFWVSWTIGMSHWYLENPQTFSVHPPSLLWRNVVHTHTWSSLSEFLHPGEKRKLENMFESAPLHPQVLWLHSNS
jgi:hypothetical protein